MMTKVTSENRICLLCSSKAHGRSEYCGRHSMTKRAKVEDLSKCGSQIDMEITLRSCIDGIASKMEKEM